MLEVSASKLRSNLFGYLDKASDGETIVITRNNKEVARIIPTERINWREKMSISPQIMVSPDELIDSIDDIWEDYT